MSSQEYPLLIDSYPSSPRSKSPSQMSEYSTQIRNSSSQILTPTGTDTETSHSHTRSRSSSHHEHEGVMVA